MNRRYQRKLVWTLEEKQKLTESVLKRYPIPAILLAEREQGGYEVIDGLQRLHTLMSFIETSFPGSDGRYFNVSEYPTANTRSAEGVFHVVGTDEDRLSPREVGTYLDYSMAISVMRNATDEEIDEVFSRINTYGHRLSDQERRQAGVQNQFSRLVRSLSSDIRGDVSDDILSLVDMPQVSIDLPMTRHGYSVAAGEVFWVNEGILRSTDLRDSMDEQCIADVAASVITGSLIARSKDALDEVYRDGSEAGRALESALAGYGSDKFTAEFKYIVDQVRLICTENGVSIKLRNLLFARSSTNPYPAVFAVLAIALHELFVQDGLQIANFSAVRESLRNLDRRIDTSRGSTSPQERRQNINTIKGLIAPHLVDAQARELYDRQSTVDIDDTIRRSEVEAPHFELKQGLLRLDDTRGMDTAVLPAIIETICAIANNGTGRTGCLILGVADKPQDASRIEQLDKITPRMVGQRAVVGVRREAVKLGETPEAYFQRLRDAIGNSQLSEPLRSAVLAGLSFNDYFGLGVILINIPAQAEVSSIGERVYVRAGDQTKEVAGIELINVARRF